MVTKTAVTFADVLGELLSPEAPPMPLDVAQWARALQLPEAKKERMLQLADLGNCSELTRDEDREMATYRDVGDFLTLLHAKARLSLRQIFGGGSYGHRT